MSLGAAARNSGDRHPLAGSVLYLQRPDGGVVSGPLRATGKVGALGPLGGAPIPIKDAIVARGRLVPIGGPGIAVCCTPGAGPVDLGAVAGGFVNSVRGRRRTRP